MMLWGLAFWLAIVQALPRSSFGFSALKTNHSLSLFSKGGKDIAENTLHLFPDQKLLHFALESGFWFRMIQEAIDRPSIVHQPTDRQYVDNLLVMGDSLHLLGVSQALERNPHIKNVGFFEFADEHGFSEAAKTIYKNASFVIRNYYFPEIFSKYEEKVVWMPNGPRDGVKVPSGSKMTPASNRTHSINFVGTLRADRALLTRILEHLKTTDPSIIVESSHGFGGKRSATSYATILLESTFTTIPRGNSPETIRLYDALECGSIPIIKDKAEYLSQFGETAPFVFVEEWTDIPAILDDFRANPAKFDQLQTRLQHFYRNMQRTLKRKIRTVVDAAFQARYSCSTRC